MRENEPVLLIVDLKVRELRELQVLEMDSETRLDFIPDFKSYLYENDLPLDQVLEEIPDDQWFWYDIRNVFLVRKDHADRVKQRFNQTMEN